jgi:hypothetical protein
MEVSDSYIDEILSATPYNAVLEHLLLRWYKETLVTHNLREN